MPDFSEMIDSRVWWKIKTGWNDKEYVERKNALLKRLRRVWPNKTGTYTYGSLSNGIISLVATLDDSSWCLPHKKDRTVVFAEQLRLYTEWAKHIQSQRKNMEDDEWYTAPASGNDSVFPLIFGREADPVLVMPPLVESVQDSTSLSTPAIATAVAKLTARSPEGKPFDWDNVVICIDSRIEDDAIYYIPVTDLKPGSPSTPCHWYEFTRDRFYEAFEEETGMDYDPEEYSMFWVDRKREYVKIESSGAYRLMFKRFSEEFGSKDVLNLIIDDDKNDRLGKPIYSADPRSLKRKDPPE